MILAVEKDRWANSLDELTYITARLLRFSRVALLGAAGNAILTSAFTVLTRPWRFGASPYLFEGASIAAGLVSILLASISIAATARFESARKRGDTLFQIISELYQSDYYLRTTISEKSPDSGSDEVAKRIVVEEMIAREALRNFTSSSDLPLASGHAGPTIYALVNIALLLVNLVLPWI